MNNHLLHIDTSFRNGSSRSRRLSARFAESWRRLHPDGTVTYRDLAAHPLPHLDEAAFTANVTPADQRTAEQRAARALTDEVVGEVLAADTIVIGMPLYNFGAPSTLKAWVDRLVVPGVTVGENGGMLVGRRVVFAGSRGGGYGPGTPREGWDHGEPWLRHALSTVGLDDLSFVTAELTLARESPAMIPLDLGAAEDRSMEDALRAIADLAA